MFTYSGLLPYGFVALGFALYCAEVSAIGPLPIPHKVAYRLHYNI